jgi:hypothetical protein
MSHRTTGRPARARACFIERLEPRQLFAAIPSSDPLALTSAADVPKQLEKLNRGLVAVNKGSGQVYLSWRLLAGDAGNIAFDVYRSTNGGTFVKRNSSPITTTTNFTDTGVTTSSTNAWYIRPIVNNIAQAPSETFTLAAGSAVQQYLKVPIQPPAGGTSPDGVAYTYAANDGTVGDVDGDGQYEIILKWDPTNSKDGGIAGYSGNVYIDAYTLTGVRLWRIDMGRNVRAGAHYTQPMVYDLDGDGRAEVAMRTADGTVSGTGQVIGDANADYRQSNGFVLTGPEFLTVFNGLTGAAMSTIPFQPARGDFTTWGDDYGNRVDRFLSAIAYLDGQRPSLIMARGFYGPRLNGDPARNEIVAYNWRDVQLTQLWHFKAGLNYYNNLNSNYISQGNHNLSIADVDADGRDEIIYGAMTLDDNGQGLYSTGLGHGDALHVSDMDPSRPGLEVFGVHESPTAYNSLGVDAGGSFRDARTGALIFGIPGNGADVGRGVAMDIDPRYPGFEMWTSADGGIYNVSGQRVADKPSNMFMNFGLWWDADLSRELLDGTTISKWDTSINGRTNLVYAPSGLASNNSTKKTPVLSGDILGDWREEVIWRQSDNLALQIWTTTIPATNRLTTLMHDLQYRESIAWQNTGYNQPPHTSYFLGTGMNTPPAPKAYFAKALTPPAALAADNASDNRIQLSWTDTTNTTATAYEIEMAIGNGAFAPLATVDASQRAYLTQALTPGTTYRFRVRATGLAPASAYSTTTSATVPNPVAPVDLALHRHAAAS